MVIGADRESLGETCNICGTGFEAGEECLRLFVGKFLGFKGVMFCGEVLYH